MSERSQSPEFSIHHSEQQAKKLEKMLKFQDWPDEIEKIILSTPEGQDYKDYTIDHAINRMKKRLPNLHEDLDNGIQTN
jgi:hypothetical protein